MFLSCFIYLTYILHDKNDKNISEMISGQGHVIGEVKVRQEGDVVTSHIIT